MAMARGLWEGLYRVLMRRNSVYVTFVIAGAFAGERAVDYGVHKLWERNNVGFGSHSKKQLHNLVLGRMYDHHVYDLVETETKAETCCSWLLLPLDIMADILSRLPAKSIAKFLCACKQWLSLTHDARFLRSLHARSASYVIIDKYIVNGKVEPYDFSIGDGGKPKKISYTLNLGSNCYRRGMRTVLCWAKGSPRNVDSNSDLS
ncbi:uncharacterized protein A4U43_C04F6410 [Asparagus officinalis]|uniref:Complex III subunit 9 n=1 Tax=Asparagus officinalis TaxID=4686 RepID=A0A5P1EZD5_ASPOF|nr:uncharacterized protein A4U43_C04F6410 [Asparagus officinalis]